MQSVSHPDPLCSHSVALITVSYGSGEALSTFLSSLRAHEGADTPVVVVDNKPDHENVRELAAQYGALYVPLPQNPGYGAGMNAGVTALLTNHPTTEFDAFFFCNPDVRFIAPVVQGIAGKLLSAPTAGSAGPELRNTDGTIYPSARNIPSIGTGCGHALFSKIWPTNPWTSRYQAAKHTGVERAAGSLSGAAVMVSTTVYHQLHGWDEAYFLHFEDIDLGWRIGQLGLENLYLPQFSVEHSGAHSTKNHAALVERAMTQSALRFLGKRYAGWWNAPLRGLMAIGLRTREKVKLRSAPEREGNDKL